MARERVLKKKQDVPAEEILPVNIPTTDITKAEPIEERFLTKEEFVKLLDKVKTMSFEEVLARTDGNDLSPGQKVYMLKILAETQKKGATHTVSKNEPGFLKTVFCGLAIVAKKIFVTTKEGAPSWFFHVWSTLFAAATRVRVYKERYGEDLIFEGKSKEDECNTVWIIPMALVAILTLISYPISSDLKFSWWYFGIPLVSYWLSQLISLGYEIGRKSLKEDKK